jgi:hypothetical protein
MNKFPLVFHIFHTLASDQQVNSLGDAYRDGPSASDGPGGERSFRIFSCWSAVVVTVVTHRPDVKRGKIAEELKANTGTLERDNIGTSIRKARQFIQIDYR